MEKITVKELTEFRKISDKRKKTLAFNLKNRPPKVKKQDEEGKGGDYWKSSTSCIYEVFKHNKEELYSSKIEEIRIKFNNAIIKRIKDMHQRNIDILNNFMDFEFDDVKPNYDLKYEPIPRNSKIVTLDNFPLFVNPGVVFSFEKNGKKELGALWLVTLLNGYKKEELGMFCEMLYKFLKRNYSDDSQLSLDYCVVIDTFSGRKVTYSELVNGDVPFLVDITLEEIKKL
jgi:hypothetical protein